MEDARKLNPPWLVAVWPGMGQLHLTPSIVAPQRATMIGGRFRAVHSR